MSVTMVRDSVTLTVNEVPVLSAEQVKGAGEIHRHDAAFESGLGVISGQAAVYNRADMHLAPDKMVVGAEIKPPGGCKRCNRCWYAK